ncbi:MAG: hypothetical protein E7B29_20420, partial [Mixta calida]|nr:hypothetical protein [Mixta calida]
MAYAVRRFQKKRGQQEKWSAAESVKSRKAGEQNAEAGFARLERSGMHLNLRVVIRAVAQLRLPPDSELLQIG